MEITRASWGRRVLSTVPIKLPARIQIQLPNILDFIGLGLSHGVQFAKLILYFLLHFLFLVTLHLLTSMPARVTI